MGCENENESPLGDAASGESLRQELARLFGASSVALDESLVVDDDPGIRMLCAASLADAGVGVLEAEDGGRGLERALEERPDLVLLDVNMPVLDGFALAARLREDERTSNVSFVFLTGELEPESRTKAYALGAAGFVSKPFDPGAVTALVAGLLARIPGSTEPLSA